MFNVSHVAVVCLKSKMCCSKSNIWEMKKNYDCSKAEHNAFLGAVNGKEFTSLPWRIVVQVEGHEIQS